MEAGDDESNGHLYESNERRDEIFSIQILLVIYIQLNSGIQSQVADMVRHRF